MGGLTEEQRARIRQANIEHLQAMHAFGQSLAASNDKGLDAEDSDLNEAAEVPVTFVTHPRSPR